MAGVWSLEIKTESLASPKETECCDMAEQERNTMWLAILLCNNEFETLGTSEMWRNYKISSLPLSITVQSQNK